MRFHGARIGRARSVNPTLQLCSADWILEAKITSAAMRSALVSQKTNAMEHHQMRPVNGHKYFETAAQPPKPSIAGSQAGSSLAGILASGAATGAEASTQVSLSADARAFANLASKGIAVAVRGLNVTQSSSGSDLSVSKDDFDGLLARLGATTEEKRQLESGLDTDKSGDISRDELLKGLAATGGATSSSETSMALLHVMDRSGDSNGKVDGGEFGRFTAAFLDAAKPRA